jgi:hypothetical protein
LNSREVKNLEKYCIEHAIDLQLIDNSLTYDENMDTLEQLVIGEEPELAEIKALEEWYNAQSYAETFGTEAFKDGRLPPIFHRTMIHFKSRRRMVRFGRTKWGQPLQHGGNVDPKKVIFHELPHLPKLILFILWIVPDPKMIEKIHYRKRNDRPIWDGYITITGQWTDIARTCSILRKYGHLRTISTRQVYNENVQYLPTIGLVVKP